MTNEEAKAIIWKNTFHPWIKKCAFNEDVMIVLLKQETFVYFWRTDVIQSEETFEGAIHKYFY